MPVTKFLFLLLAVFLSCNMVDMSTYKKIYFDQITYKEFQLKRNVPISLKSSNQTRHLKDGVNATIVFKSATPGDNILIQTYTFATNCTRIKLHVYNGQRVDDSTELTKSGGLCGIIHPSQFLSFNSSLGALTLNYLTSNTGGDPAGGFNWTVLAYHTEPCSRNEMKCAKGKCYPNPLLCDGNLSCSDKGNDYVCVKSDTKTVSFPAWVICTVAGVGVPVTVAVPLAIVRFLRRRKRKTQVPYKGMRQEHC